MVSNCMRVRNGQCLFRAKSNLHVNIDILPSVIFRRGHIESPQDSSDIEVDRRSPEMHAGTDAATPAKCGVAEGTGEVAVLEKALRLELVRFREVVLVKMNYRGKSQRLSVAGRGRKTANYVD